MSKYFCARVGIEVKLQILIYKMKSTREPEEQFRGVNVKIASVVKWNVKFLPNKRPLKTQVGKAHQKNVCERMNIHLLLASLGVTLTKALFWDRVTLVATTAVAAKIEHFTRKQSSTEVSWKNHMLKRAKSIEKRPLSIIPKSTLNTQAPGTSIFLVAKNKVPAPACSCIFWNTLKITTAGQIRTLLYDGSGLFLSLEGGMSEYLGVKSSYSLFCCGTKSCFVTLLLLLKLSCISQGRQFFQLEFLSAC